MKSQRVEKEFSDCLKSVVTELVMFDPENDLLTYNTRNFSPNVFDIVDTDDIDYENKTIALLLVCYYAIKNRCFNYAFKANANHEEVVYTENMRLWLETNSEKIIADNDNIKKMFARLMVLIYDKLLSCKVELFCEGNTVPDGFIGFNTGGLTFGNLTYKNTSKTIYILGMQLIQIWNRKEQYIDNRNFWAKTCGSDEIQNCKNTFLYNCYDLAEINRFLKPKYNIVLKPMKTKWYKSYLSNWKKGGITGLSAFNIVRMIILNFQGNYEDSLAVSGAGTPAEKYSFFDKIWSIFKTILFSLIFIVPLAFLATLFDEKVNNVIMFIAQLVCLFFMIPFGNRIFETKKRKTFSLLKNIK